MGEQISFATPAQGRLMLIRRACTPEALRQDTFDSWSYTVPCVAELGEHGLTFQSPATMLVGGHITGTCATSCTNPAR